MRIGIHQPNFLPWMGYFFKMAQCDRFVFLDNVEYTKKSYTKRVKIHKSQDINRDQYIIVPLQKHSDHELISKLKISNHHRWQKKVSNQLYETYHKAPFYHQIVPLIDHFFNQKIGNDSFSSFTIEILNYVSKLLGLQTELLLASDLSIERKTQNINIDIVHKLNGQAYISGVGAQKYQTGSIFSNEGINLIYCDFQAKFKELEVPNHFLNKSTIAYLAFYPIEELRSFLKGTL